jgi:hypothetical protein
MTHDELLDALIAAGWGEVPRAKIPENWRELPPPGPPVLLKQVPLKSEPGSVSEGRRHGLRGTYKAGCRCYACTKANRDYHRPRMRAWYRQKNGFEGSGSGSVWIGGTK